MTGPCLDRGIFPCSSERMSQREGTSLPVGWRTGMLIWLILGRGLKVPRRTLVPGRSCSFVFFIFLKQMLAWLALFSLSISRKSLIFLNYNQPSPLILQKPTKIQGSLFPGSEYRMRKVGVGRPNCWAPAVYKHLQINGVIVPKSVKRMDGQQLPKATMNSFIKAKTSLGFNPEYLARMLSISKEFVVRVSDKANVMCESYSKKTINAEHLEAAMKDFGVTEHLGQLKSLQDCIKEQNQLKREQSQRIEEMLAQDAEEERHKKRIEENPVREVVQREHFKEIERPEPGDDDLEDYENMIVDVDAISNPNSKNQEEPK